MVHNGIMIQNTVFSFQKTQRPDPWDRVRNVGELPPACPQNPDMGYVNQHSPGFNKEDEDCLYINVYVPEVK
jgi:carboxylesterase type B